MVAFRTATLVSTTTLATPVGRRRDAARGQVFMRLLPSLLLSLLVLAVGPLPVYGKGARLKTPSCSENTLNFDILLPFDGASAYLQHFKSHAEPACQPEVNDGVARFSLPLDDVFKCGVTRVISQHTGIRTYWIRVVVVGSDDSEQDVLTAKCSAASSVPGASRVGANRTRRNVLPAGFQEEEVLEVRQVETTVQPPHLGVAVRQGGQLVTGELNVNPGTPLNMEIFLDETAAPIYGLLVSHMTVSDTKAQEETIVFNGCSVDPYLFENFNTVDGDFLSAKFRAFKFPESSFVQFRGTVTVCLDKCRGVECSNGVIGYGRKRRDVATLPPDPNKVFEVALSAFIKVEYEKEVMPNVEKALLAARSDAPAAAESGNILGTVPAASSGIEVAKEELPDYTVTIPMSQAPVMATMPLLVFSILLALLQW